MWLFGGLTVVLVQICVAEWPNPRVRSKGAIWPQPQFVRYLPETMTIDVKKFVFISIPFHCDIIDKALARYHKRLFGNEQVMEWGRKREAATQTRVNSEVVLDYLPLTD